MYNVSGLSTETSDDNFNSTTATPNPLTHVQAKLEWDIGTGILIVEFVLAFILNGLIIFLIRRKSKRNRVSFFFMHLAISDFLMSIFFILHSVIDRLVDEWLAGEFLCRSSQYLSLAVCYGSTYMLVVLSADRLYAVVSPLSAVRRGKGYKWTVVTTAWIIAFSLATQNGVFSELKEMGKKPGTNVCQILYPKEIGKQMVLLFCTLNMFLPAVLISVCYISIVILLWRRNRYNMSNKSDNKNCDVKPQCKLISKAKRKTIVITFTVVSVFILCWSPFTFNMIFAMYDVFEEPYFFVLMALAPLNSVANPIVFLIYNRSIIKPDQRSSTLRRT